MEKKVSASQSKRRSASHSRLKVPAIYMRGGTSKGVFFNLADLPEKMKQAGTERDAFLLRVIGSPDPYSKQIDGMGGATSSTSKIVILAKSDSIDHDVDYLFGQVSIDKPFVDWSGNCGNLSSAVGSCAIHMGLIEQDKIPFDGHLAVKVRQMNINKTIIVHVPISQGEVQEKGDFELDGVAFPSAEIQVDFIDPADGKGAMFPTGNLIDELDIPSLGKIEATLINSGIPTIFIKAEDVDYQGTELQDDINNDEKALAMFESIRAHGALKMGLINNLDQAVQRQHTPKIAFVSPAKSYQTSSGKFLDKSEIDVLVRALSMGQLHHAMMGTAAVAIASAAIVPGTLVNQATGGIKSDSVTFGHPSGKLKVGAKAQETEQGWIIEKAIMNRSARVIMEGWVIA